MTAETVMVLLTGVSIVAAAISIAVARGARDEANRANLLSTAANSIARDANKLAEDSNLVAKDAVETVAQSNRMYSEANAIARAAADTARNVPIEVAWDEALVAIAALQTANPADPKEQVGPLLTALRTRIFLLIDRLDWDGFGDWIA
ncbi:MAG: hypothetical protein WA966_03705, partial [Ornithinimicrobium sp.]